MDLALADTTAPMEPPIALDVVTNTLPFVEGVYLVGTTVEGLCGADALQRFWPTKAPNYYFDCYAKDFAFRRSDWQLFYKAAGGSIRQDVAGPAAPEVAASTPARQSSGHEVDFGTAMRSLQMTNDRAPHLRRAVRLELLTLGWNLLEGAIAVTAALVAGSVALLAFGIDSFVESASAGIMLWRLLAERKAGSAEDIEALEAKARKLIAASLLALAAWVLYDAGRALWMAEEPRPSVVGIVLTSISLVVMLWLARAKRQVAAALQSRALEADSFQTTACWWLSLSALVGITLNAALGWWWADPAAALVIVFFLLKEGREAWKGHDSCSDCGH